MDDSRPFTAAEINFFSERGTGSGEPTDSMLTSSSNMFSAEVPVIALFTKFDALDDKAYDVLEKEGVSWEESKKQAPIRAVADFEKVHLGSLYGRKYPPKAHIYLRGMILLLSRASGP